MSVRYVERGFLVAGGLFLLLWAFEPTRNALRDTGIFNQSSVIAATGLMLALTVRGLMDFQKSLDGVGSSIRGFRSSVRELRANEGTPVIEGGVGTIYPHLRAACVASANREGKSLHVLGLTLYTAWPQIRSWISDSTLSGWDIVMYCISPDFIASASDCFLPEWAEEAASQLHSIRAYLAQNDVLLKRTNTRLSVHEYAFFPAFHGFQLGDGTSFVSITRWEPGGEGPRLEYPHAPYVVVAADDETASGTLHRATLENWLWRAGNA